jgi:inner membrane protein
MDNITHTLIGVLVGEASATYIPAKRSALSISQRRNLYVTLMGVGSNLPDLDFLYSTITGSKLDYLLHHRGHTHTLLGIIAVALLLGLAGECWLRKRAPEVTRSDRGGLWLIALLAPALHVAMDAANNYGIHPWWPLQSQWIYGDSIFIIEPLLWASCAPLMFLLRTRIARGCVALVLIAGAVLAFITELVPGTLIGVYLILAFALGIAGSKLPRAGAVGAGLALWLGVTIVFTVTSAQMQDRLDRISRDSFPNATALDQVLTPMPMNPFCWEVILVQREADAIVLRRAMMAAVASLIPASECPGRSLKIPITAPLTDIAAPDTPSLRWHGQIESSAAHLQRLWRERCQVNAVMRFVRAPWLARIDQAWVIGDLRYDREKALGFAEIEVDPPDEGCPSHLPSWTPPRIDLQ